MTSYSNLQCAYTIGIFTTYMLLETEVGTLSQNVVKIVIYSTLHCISEINADYSR